MKRGLQLRSDSRNGGSPDSRKAILLDFGNKTDKEVEYGGWYHQSPGIGKSLMNFLVV